MEYSQEEQSVVMAQFSLDAALAELNYLQSTAKLTGTEDENVISMMEMMNAIVVNQAESIVRQAQMQLEDAQNHSMNAQEQKRILDLIQILSQGSHCKLQKRFYKSNLELNYEKSINTF